MEFGLLKVRENVIFFEFFFDKNICICLENTQIKYETIALLLSFTVWVFLGVFFVITVHLFEHQRLFL